MRDKRFEKLILKYLETILMKLEDGVIEGAEQDLRDLISNLRSLDEERINVWKSFISEENK